MNIEIQELISKRNSDIDKLNNYLSSGKTSEEKIVKKTIDKIRHAENLFDKLGYTDYIKVNDDGTFESKKNETDKEIDTIPTTNETNEINLSENINNTEIEDDVEIQKNTDITEKSNSDEKINSSNEFSNPKKILKKSIKSQTEPLCVSIKESNKNNLLILAKDSGRTPNNVVNLMLKEVFNEDENKFIVDFKKKEKANSTSYLIDSVYAKEIDKISKKTGLSKSDIFNVLIETALKDYI